ncbi:anthranilate synthase component I family protein [Acinetobacter gerneri]|uniref:Chorismate-utilising enzyme C-terminal domain-containing protein n=1 Tax=Acinetobacter gerneri DSM 14967 = CIP 107464 = MTCC 9824 TaxID=1120926 RepID=N8ZQ61_9GAMM|nr:anthranilate synthase component I family protein [Acinetobacter gerneri]ENV33605.1 hypothetical protein F960_01984 [Acinetobacter gerneri DSM 14967 = CIP 107464 = MTCC 9824]EPR84713.1 Para-aminobenzoate synthase, aminase component [Acinetobacter gerneri DSM 14967 = CIP 107464 = MTCC 9824]
MINPSFFKKSLGYTTKQLPQILKSLSVLNGFIYVKNNKQPIIAILPSNYFLNTSTGIQLFTRNDKLEYTPNNGQNIFEFVQTNNLNFHSNNNEFNGGYMGFVSYDYAAQNQINCSVKLQPSLYIGQYDTFLKFENDQLFLYSYEENHNKITDLIEKTLDKNIISVNNAFRLKAPIRARWDKHQYQAAFNSIQNYIKAGDCYQINLTQEFSAECSGNLIDISHDLWNLTEAPYSGFLSIDGLQILSCSPELFIDFNAGKQLVTRPIKGTMPRYVDEKLDQESKQKLKNSQKDQAENLMIVDLLRNDLSVYAEIGSVKTPKLFEIESFNQVHHMVSEITATLKADINPFKVLIDALPGGSITGAPKIRAMQIIDELEGAPRGAYCGSLGYFNYDGTGSWNILIRSVQKYQEQLSIWAGGGITIASDCDAEYQECFDKVSAMLDLINTWYKPESD